MARPFVRRVGTSDESGTGIIGSALGAATFLGFLLLATNTLVGLYATSVATAVAWDEARLVADDSTTPDQARLETIDRLRSLHDVQVDCDVDGNDVVLQLDAQRPALLPAALLQNASLTRIHRTIHIRHETLH